MTRPPVTLIGLKLPKKTTNENGQAMSDCGNHWQKFEQEGIFDKIPNKTDFVVYAVYFDYEGDHTKPYSYFVGSPVATGTAVPEGLDTLEVPAQDYEHIIAMGKMPDCVAEAWMQIWKGSHNRAYGYDFEIYSEKSSDWNNAEVDIYLSITK
jgi:predicted transcriptional regulator YdeE